MKFHDINLAGFGKLVKREFHFTPGLNLVIGPNESGKSTLQRALLVGLYSFFDDGTITANKRAVVANFQPWTPYVTYGLSLAFSLESGKHYQVKRTFDPYETSIISLSTKRDVTANFSKSSNGRVFFADSLLGMPKEVFENTCFVRQAELVALEKSASAIRDTLLKLSASASQEATVTQALEQLDEILRNQIGNDRARVKPLPVASSNVTALKAKRVQAVNERAMLETQINQLAQLEETFKNQEREIEEKKYLLMVAQKNEISIQLGSVDRAIAEEQVAKKKMEELQGWSGFPTDLVPAYQKLKVELDQSLSELTKRKLRALQGLQGLPEFYQQLNKIGSELAQHRHRPAAVIDTPPSVESGDIGLVAMVEEWFSTAMTALKSEALGLQEEADLEKAALAPVLAPGNRGISNWLVDLRTARSQHNQAETSLRKASKSWKEAGFPIDSWDAILAEKIAQANEYAKWKEFPVQRWNDIQLLERQRVTLQERLASNRDEHEQRKSELKTLDERITGLQDAKQSLEPLPSLSNKQREEIQVLYNQEQQAADTLRRTEERRKMAGQELLVAQAGLIPEQQALEQLLQTGPDSLSVLKGRLQIAQEKFAQARQRYTAAHADWERVGMSASKFQELQTTVKSIQAGALPTPTQRKGCMSFLMPFIRRFQNAKTPDEILFYSQVQPIYSEFDRSKLELDKAESGLQSVLTEAEKILGPGVPVEPAAFDSLSQRLSAYQLKANRLESQASNVAEFEKELNQAKLEHINKLTNLLNELRLLGLDIGEDLSKAWQLYQDALKRIQRWNDLKGELENLQLKRQALLTQQHGVLEQVDDLSALEKRLSELLDNPSGLDEGLKQFRSGLQQHQAWLQRSSDAEKMRGLINNFQTQQQELLQVKARAETEWNNLRNEIRLNFTGLVNTDNEDLGLDLVNRRLESYKELEKVLGSTYQRIETLRLQMHTVFKDGKTWQEITATIDEQSRQIIGLFKSAGIPCEISALDEGAHQFEDAARKNLAWQQASQSHQSAGQTVAKLQEGLAQSKAQLTGIEIQLAGMQKKNPRLTSSQAKDSAQVYQRTIETLETEHQNNRSQIVRLRETTQRMQNQLRHLAELDEEIALAQAEVTRLEFFQSSLELARDTLQTAAKDFQKQFAPRLEMEMKPALKRITQSRYEDIRVSPETLDVEVLSPEQKKFISTGVLSAGTRDLIYLILRMGLARLMSNSGEKLPLLLDDPLVQYDPHRKHEALDYLLGLAETTQVFFFSADNTIKNILADQKGKSIHQVIEMA